MRTHAAAVAAFLAMLAASATRNAHAQLTPRDLAEKKEGFYATPIPLVDVDPDTGFGFGARAYLYWNGARADPGYDVTPYRHRVSVNVFTTTNGYQQHYVDYDAPEFLDSRFRLRAQATYERNTSQNYFGRGAATLAPLTFPAAGGRSYSSFADYTAALRQIRPGAGAPGSVAYSLHDKYLIEDPGASASIERSYLGRRVRILAGFGVQHVRIGDYTGAATTGDEASYSGLAARMGTTRLAEDCAAARVAGCSGGFLDGVKLGVSFDTRDFEPDPNGGVFVDVTGELSNRALGSAYDYARLTVAPRAFVSPFPRLADVVVAARAVYSVQSAGTPFFAMNGLAFTDGDRQGLGGLWTLRGFRQDRFVGPIAALGNLEVRWTFLDVEAAAQRIGLQVAPFVDAGRVFDRIADFTFADWKVGAGAGLHVLWNKATIVSVYYGASAEDQGVYMDFGEQF